VAACPQCEATEQTDEQTLSGLGKDSKIAWGVQLLVQALERALALGRLVDAERIVRRATAQVEELVASGAAVDDGALGALAVQAASTTLATNDPTWALWVIDIYRRVNRVPPLAVAESLGEVGVRHGAIVRPALEALLEHLDAQVRSSSHPQAHPHPQPQPQPDERGEALTRLAHLRRALAEAGLGTAEGAGSWSGRQGRS
jgi:hypothetical protein